MSTVVLHARSPSTSSFASSAPDEDFDFARLDDAADAVRSHDVPMIHPGAVVLAHPEDVSPRARAAAAAESAMTVASLQEELRETKRRLEAYRGARMASRLIHTQKKTAAALIEENPALAIPARLKEEARDAALALERERSRIAELEREVEKTREEMKNAVRDAQERAEERVRIAEEEAASRVDDAKLIARAAREAQQDALTTGRNLSAALFDTRTALEFEQQKVHGFERESRVLHDTVLSTKAIAEEARRKALAEAAAARVAAREKLFSVLRSMGGDSRRDALDTSRSDGDEKKTPSSPIDRDRSIGSTGVDDASLLGSPRVDPYAYAARLRSMREARR